MAYPSFRLFAGQCVDNTQIGIVARHCIDFFSIDGVFESSGGIQQ
jgi:hypothetical protein